MKRNSCQQCQLLVAILTLLAIGQQSFTGEVSLVGQAWTLSAQVALESQVLLGHVYGEHEQECIG